MEAWGFSTWVRESGSIWAFPTILFMHTLGMSIVAGGNAVIDLVLLGFWPKGGAVALAAFQEGVRQPLFWMLFGAALVLMLVSRVKLPAFFRNEKRLVAGDPIVVVTPEETFAPADTML